MQLQGPVVITGVSLEHIPRELTPNGSRVSAPKEFQVWVCMHAGLLLLCV